MGVCLQFHIPIPDVNISSDDDRKHDEQVQGTRRELSIITLKYSRFLLNQIKLNVQLNSYHFTFTERSNNTLKVLYT